MHVDQRLVWHRCRQQGVARSRHFAQARSEREHQVGLADALGKLWIDADADITDVIGVAVVEHILGAECAGDGQVVRLDEALQVVARGFGPARATDDDNGALRTAQQPSQRRHLDVGRCRLHGLVTKGIRDVDRARLHVFGQGEHDRPRTAAGGDLEGARNKLRDALSLVDLRDPLCHRAEHASIVDLLEGFAFGEVVADLADEQDDRGRILERRVNADGRVGRTRATRDEGHTGLTGELGVGVGHERSARLMARDDQLDHLARVVECVEHADIALARHAERVIDALDQELVDEDAGAGARSHADGARAKAGRIPVRSRRDRASGAVAYNARRRGR